MVIILKIFGIVIEANPFHNGHKYFINKIKEDHKPDILIAVTSTSFSMRGEISLIDKFDKTKILLENGIDIVLELPFTYAIQSADFFAQNAIKILNDIGVTDIIFGSETTNISLYNKIYPLLNEINYENKNLSKKNNFKLLLEKNKFENDEIKIIESPNFTLGMQYIKFIKDNNLKINYHLLQRISNNYHDKIITSNIASATAIRTSYKNNLDVNNLIPYDKSRFVDIKKSEDNLFNIIKYNYVVNNNYIKTDFLANEGIQNYIRNNGDFNSDYYSFIDQLKNKKYTISTISRSILHNLLETSSINNLEIEYIRILGINKIGLEHIKSLDKSIKNKIFSNPNELKFKEQTIINEILNYELKATSLYGVITNKNILINEYKLPIRKDN